MSLKGILSAGMRDETTAKGKKKRIIYCRTAFLGIYGIGKKTRWENIKRHFDNFDIQSRANSLTGKVSNRAILFDGVL